MADGRHFQKTVKSLYLCNRLTDFDKIWRHLEKSRKSRRFDRSLWNLVRWRKMCPLTAQTIKNSNFTNPRWRTAAILKKPLNRYISAIVWPILIRFGTMTHWSLTADLWLKFRIFENPKWRRPPSWKITKIAISPQRFDRSLWNLVLWCKMCPLTAPIIKNSNFTNPRWRTAAILKTVKSPYLCNRLNDFDEIWQDDAYWPPTADRPLKFWISPF